MHTETLPSTVFVPSFLHQRTLNRLSSCFSLTELTSTRLTRAGKRKEHLISPFSPLHKAVLNPLIRVLLVKILVQNGSDVNLMNNHGETPLHYAIHLNRKDLVFYLLAGGCDFHAKGKNENARSAYELAKEGEHNDIVNLFDKAQILSQWLHEINMQKYLENFIREAIFVDVLGSVDDEVCLCSHSH